MKSIILHTLDDAKDVVLHQNDNSNKLFTTNPAVIDWLAKDNILCTDLTEYLTDDDVREAKLQSSSEVSNLLLELDSVYSERLCSLFDIPHIPVFQPLFGYIGIFEHMALSLYHKTIAHLIENQAENLNIYSSENNCFFMPGDNYSVVTDYLKTRNINGISYRKSSVMISRDCSESVNLWRKTRSELGQLKRWLLIPLSRYSWNHCRILFIDILYDLQWTPPYLKKTFVLPKNGLPPGRNLLDINWDEARNIIQIQPLPDISEPSFSDYLKQILHQRFLNHLNNNLNTIFTPLILLHRKNLKTQFSLLALGSSPVMGQKSLISEYFKMTGLPVVLMQHGGNYGIQELLGCHLESDYNRCTHFLSYGFTGADLPAEELPTLPPKIISVGSIQMNTIRKRFKHYRKSKYDLIFPITNTLPLLEGALRIRNAQLTLWQRELLTRLNKLSVKILVKPFSGSKDLPSAYCEHLRNLTNLVVDDTISFTEALDKYRPRAVISEFPSSPLYESLYDDKIQIFQMEDPVLPFLPHARSILEKRVFLYHEPGKLITDLEAWLEGKLPSRTDSIFRRRFLLPEADPQKSVTNFFKGLFETV